MEPKYANLLKTLGYPVFEIDGVNWYAYNGFLRPACLPHVQPQIRSEQARRALAASGCRFVRWESDFGQAQGSRWWHVLRQAPYSMDQLSGNTRSKVRRGAKRLSARRLDPDVVAAQGMNVCRAAVERYGRDGFLPSEQVFEAKVEAARRHPESFEFFGVFRDDQLVGYSENHIDSGAVFWESIWYDPDALRDYSSYLLTHAMLDYYLNELGLHYASDGSRSLYHDTGVQNFFVEKFGFRRQYARLHVLYSPMLARVMIALRPFQTLIEKAKQGSRFDIFARLNGVLLQDEIARSEQGKS